LGSDFLADELLSTEGGEKDESSTLYDRKRLISGLISDKESRKGWLFCVT